MRSAAVRAELTDTRRADVSPKAAPPRNTLERMPKWLICVPLVLQWLLLALRYQSLTLPTIANPGITAGGLVGEGKLEYFDGMGSVALASVAAYCALPSGKRYTGAELRQAMNATGLSFPIIAKPDLGLCGYGVRLVADRAELLNYLRAFPANETVLLQQYLPQELEAGVFYIRDPHAEAGRVIGLALRYFPQVTGDGIHTIAELIDMEPRAQRSRKSPRHQPNYNASQVPAFGEVVRLATIGSTRVGGLYRDGQAHITPRLTRAIDTIAKDIPAFYFGRFDIRFDSLQELSAGRAFTIMEINGAGSEAIQAWDPDVGVLTGFKMIFKKQRILFAIGDVMRRKGFKPLGVVALARLNRKQNKLIAQYPPSN